MSKRDLANHLVEILMALLEYAEKEHTGEEPVKLDASMDEWRALNAMVCDLTINAVRPSAVHRDAISEFYAHYMSNLTMLLTMPSELRKDIIKPWFGGLEKIAKMAQESKNIDPVKEAEKIIEKAQDKPAD